MYRKLKGLIQFANETDTPSLAGINGLHECVHTYIMCTEALRSADKWKICFIITITIIVIECYETSGTR